MRNTHGIIARSVQRTAEFSFVAILGAGFLSLQTLPVAFQDMAGYAGEKSQHRWMMHVKQPAGESVAAIKADAKTGRFIDPTITSSISTARMVSDVVKAGPEPEQVNRAIKGNRVVQSTARSAPKDFTAGSVLQRQSMLEPLNTGKKFARKFVQPKKATEALQVASLFHLPKPKKRKVPTKHLPTAVASLVKQSKSAILAYSAEPEVEYSPFSQVLKEEKPVKLLPKLNKGDHAWANDPLPKNSFSKKQQRCLANGIYFEARGEPVKGQAAVSQVILNRVRNPHYPNTICGVVYQNKHWYNRCQFSFACDRIRDSINNKKLYKVAQHVAAETTAGRIWLKQVGSSTHYHATYVNPKWNRKMERVGKIGLHIFYRTYGGGWS